MKNEDLYLGMRPGDLDGKPYAKFWNPEMKPLEEGHRNAIVHGPEASALGIGIDEADLLLDPGYLPLENGYCRLENGQVMTASLVKFPKAHGKMFDWWMGWHTVEPERYKLWHPRCHLINRAEKNIGDDPNISDRDKVIGNPNYVVEYVGNDIAELTLDFHEPDEFFDVSRFEEAGIQSVVIATAKPTGVPMNVAALIHLARETDDGFEMRSRYWFGTFELPGLPTRGILNRIAKSKFLAKHTMTLENGRGQVAHDGMEFSHLATFLPELYEMYHPNGKFDPNPQV